MKKIIVGGLITGALLLITGMALGTLFSFILPSLAAEYQNSDIFRPWSDPLMSLMFLQPFITGILLAWIWSNTKHLIRARTDTSKGIRFGFIYWLFTLSGMIMSYSSFQISPDMVMQWTVNNLVGALLAGLTLSFLDRKKASV